MEKEKMIEKELMMLIEEDKINKDRKSLKYHTMALNYTKERIKKMEELEMKKEMIKKEIKKERPYLQEVSEDLLKKVYEKLEEYDKESLEDFDPYWDISFYTSNLVNGRIIEQKAIQKLKERYDKIDILLVNNYNTIGIVEFVADDEFYIDDNCNIVIEEF